MKLPLTIEWEDIGKAAGNFCLKLLEYCFKLCAILAAGIAMGTHGFFSEKLGTAFSGLSQALRQTIALPGELIGMGRMIRDYNMQPASDFAATYGTGAVGGLLFDLNQAVEYVITVYGNITGSFFATAGAALLAFLTFYILATVLRFARQKGQGSYLVQLERKLGNQIFSPKPAVVPGSSPTVSPPVSASPSNKSVHQFPTTTKPYIKHKSAGSSSSMAKPRSSGKGDVTRQASAPNLSSGSKPGTVSTPGRKKQKSKFEEDYAPDPQTLSLILESARTSD